MTEPAQHGYGQALRKRHYDLGVFPVQLDDPGAGGRIGAAGPAFVLLETIQAETRTLSDPLFEGQILDLFFESDKGDCVVTADSAINQTGNTTLTFADAGDHARLRGARAGGGAREWRLVADGTPGNDGVALS